MPTKPTKRGVRAALLILGLALAVRTALLFLVPLIARDGAYHAEQAARLDLGDPRCWAGDYPGFHAAIRALYALTGDLLTAVRAASFVPGVLLVPLIYGLTARVFGRRAGVVAAVVLACHTHLARMSVEGLGEPLYLLFAVPALHLSLFGALRSRPGVACLGSVAALAAVLVRPEGAGVLVVAAVAALVAPFDRSTSFRRRLLVLASVLSAPLLAAGIVVGVRWALGLDRLLPVRPDEWMRVRDFAHAAIGGRDAAAAYFSRVGGIFLRYLARLPVDIHPLVLLALVFGFADAFRRGRRVRASAAWLAIVFAFYLAGFSTVWYDRRFSLQLLAFTLPLAGHGLAAAAGRIGAKFGRTPRQATLAVALVAAAVLLPQTLRPYREEKAYYLDVARWLRENAAGSRIMVVDRRLTFYVGWDTLPRVLCPTGPLELRMVEYVWRTTHGQVDVIVVGSDEDRALPEKVRGILALAAAFPPGEREIVIYRVAPPPPRTDRPPPKIPASDLPAPPQGGADASGRRLRPVESGPWGGNGR